MFLTHQSIDLMTSSGSTTSKHHLHSAYSQKLSSLQMLLTKVFYNPLELKAKRHAEKHRPQYGSRSPHHHPCPHHRSPQRPKVPPSLVTPVMGRYLISFGSTNMTNSNPAPLDVAKAIHEKRSPMFPMDWVILGNALRLTCSLGLIRENYGCFDDWGGYSITTQGKKALGLLT